MKKIHYILENAIRQRASDIHITNNLKPTFRIDGELVSQPNYPLMTPEMLEELTKELLDEESYEDYQKKLSYDGSTSHGGSRFRIHIFKQKKCDAMALRLIPEKIPSFREMNLPPVLRKLATVRNGLVLVTGVTGSGKSTTLAAIIDEINQNYGKHIVTVEDPVEFVHTHKKSIINQREVGVDVKSFSDAVRAAMREDPDILLVGEMRDLDTVKNAITMAETGHLVFGTLHTRSVAETVGRLIDLFPPEQQSQVRVQLANSIQAIISQQLLPKIGGGRVPLCEIMIATPAIQNLIRENSSTSSIIDSMQASAKQTGAQTRPQAAANLYLNKMTEKEDAIAVLDDSEVQLFNNYVKTYG